MSKNAKFGSMLAIPILVMCVLMYLDTSSPDHVHWSEFRAYIAPLLGAAVAVVMLGFMLCMYPSQATNLGILLVSGVVFAFALYLVRDQDRSEEVAGMKTAIAPHAIPLGATEEADLSILAAAEHR